MAWFVLDFILRLLGVALVGFGIFCVALLMGVASNLLLDIYSMIGKVLVLVIVIVGGAVLILVGAARERDE